MTINQGYRHQLTSWPRKMHLRRPGCSLMIVQIGSSPQQDGVLIVSCKMSTCSRLFPRTNFKFQFTFRRADLTLLVMGAKNESAVNEMNEMKEMASRD
uniref:Uncharacterized protein n=1 Tax=Strigamia maritima TaxID=126957 RepID=T1JKF1_STRMM